MPEVAPVTRIDFFIGYLLWSREMSCFCACADDADGCGHASPIVVAGVATMLEPVGHDVEMFGESTRRQPSGTRTALSRRCERRRQQGDDLLVDTREHVTGDLGGCREQLAHVRGLIPGERGGRHRVEACQEACFEFEVRTCQRRPQRLDGKAGEMGDDLSKE